MIHSRLVVKNQSVFQIIILYRRMKFMEIRENRGCTIGGKGIGAMAMGFEKCQL